MIHRDGKLISLKGKDRVYCLPVQLNFHPLPAQWIWRLWTPNERVPVWIKPVKSGLNAERMRLKFSPFFLALAMTSAADLLITLVTYSGQLACLAMVIARYTASVSTWNTHIRNTQHASTSATASAGVSQVCIPLQCEIKHVLQVL